jgi:hypothetical protein
VSETSDLQSTLLEGLQARLDFHDASECDLATYDAQAFQFPRNILSDALRCHLSLPSRLAETYIASMRREHCPIASPLVFDGHPTIVFGRGDDNFERVPGLEYPAILIQIDIVEFLTAAHELVSANISLEVLALRLRQRAHLLRRSFLLRSGFCSKSSHRRAEDLIAI